MIRERTKNRIKFIIILTLVTLMVAALLIAAHFRGYERSVKVEKDAYVYEYYPDNNYGANDYLRVGNYHYGKVQAYYHFNISSLPGGWREANIIVKFNYASDFVNVGANLTYESWDENTITWNNKPNVSYFRGWILCDGFDFRIPIKSNHIQDDGIGVILYGRGGMDDGYIEGKSKEGASSMSNIAVIELTYRGIEPIFLTVLRILGITICIVIGTIVVALVIHMKSPKFRKNSKYRKKPININNFGGDWLNAHQNVSKIHRLSTPTIEKEINQYITLKLEHGRTYIYVNGKRFIQCIRLVLKIAKNDIPLYDEVDSIDEAAKLYSNHIYQNTIVRGPMAAPVLNQSHDITPEQEFWGHCSNIQAWVEHDYDTRILMRNISFPLLRELVKAGDPKAKKVFKEEIALRLESGFPSVIQYLLNQGYLGYFTSSELQTIIESTELIKGLSSKPNMLSQFLKYCSFKFPSLVEVILLQVLLLPEGKQVVLSSINVPGIRGMPYVRPSFRSNPQYLLTLKKALENLLKQANEKIWEDIFECIKVIENKLEGREINLPRLSVESRWEVVKKLLEPEGLEHMGEKEKLLFIEKLLQPIRRDISKCAYCGKVIPKGKEICEWCGHKKDDDEGFFPYPFIFKPPGGGGGGRLKEGAIVIPIKT
ncbi:MAG: DNRLRE domain-containing protein [Candidatus Hodarchaeota archaeon]